MIKYLLTICTFLLFSGLAYSETILINGNSWNYAIDGTVRDNNSVLNEVNLKSDLNLNDGTSGFFVAYIEHPIPILPNIRIGSTSLSFNGAGDAATSFTYNSQTYSGTANIATDLVLDHTEIGLYWNIFDNVVGLDLGLNVKFFDGSINLTSTEGNVSDVFNETIPMLYGGLQAELPFDLRLSGDVSYISYNGSSFTDTILKLSYTTDFNFGVDVGYRSIVIDYKDTNANKFINVNISGMFVGVHLAF